MKKSTALRFVEENIKTIFAYALTRVEHKEDAEDLTNDIVVAILQNAENLRNEEAFYGYVWSIASNTCKKFLKRRNRLPSDALEDDLQGTDDVAQEVEKKDELGRLRRELALLSKEYRECTVAYYYDGLSCAQIAKKFHISLEMVKYYLFKTRKILKEGIAMEREFGEKSFKPATFSFETVVWGRDNREYNRLFERKLPGNILLSAYYTPMSVHELSVELGVASVYLEDEIALLEKYGLLVSAQGGKYRANLLIFTEAFVKEFHRTAEPFCTEEIGIVLRHIKEKLPSVRLLTGSGLDDNRLLWPLLWLVMFAGYNEYASEAALETERERLYQETTGYRYGMDFEFASLGEYGFAGCAGRGNCGEPFDYAFVDFGILPQKNHFAMTGTHTVSEKLRCIDAHEAEPDFLLLCAKTYDELECLLAEEIRRMKLLYGRTVQCASEIMKSHAPAKLGDEAERVIAGTACFRSIGLFGVCAVRSGVLALPSEEDHAPIAYFIIRPEA